MNPRATDPLAELLTTTDCAFGPPPLPSDPAGTVRRRAKRRSRERVAGISVVLLTSFGIAAVLLLRTPSGIDQRVTPAFAAATGPAS